MYSPRAQQAESNPRDPYPGGGGLSLRPRPGRGRDRRPEIRQGIRKREVATSPGRPSVESGYSAQQDGLDGEPRPEADRHGRSRGTGVAKVLKNESDGRR